MKSSAENAETYRHLQMSPSAAWPDARANRRGHAPAPCRGVRNRPPRNMPPALTYAAGSKCAAPVSKHQNTDSHLRARIIIERPVSEAGNCGARRRAICWAPCASISASLSAQHHRNCRPKRHHRPSSPPARIGNNETSRVKARNAASRPACGRAHRLAAPKRAESYERNLRLISPCAHRPISPSTRRVGARRWRVIK